MALTRTQAREKFVDLRKQMDGVAKTVLDSIGADPQEVVDEASRVSAANQKKFEEHIRGVAEECRSAFDQWEIREATPLQEHEAFMDPFRRLMSAIASFDGFAD